MAIPAPFALWDFHEGSGNTASDTKGNLSPLTAQTPAAAWSGPNAASQFNLNSFPTQNTPWTICINADVTVFTGTFLYFVTAANNFYLDAYAADKSMAIYDGSSEHRSAANALVSGENQLVWACDGTNVTLYANGVQVAGGASTAPITGRFTVAEQNSWPTGNLIRDVALWQVALTPAQVAELFNPPPPATPVNAGLSGGSSFSISTKQSYETDPILGSRGTLVAFVEAIEPEPIPVPGSDIGIIALETNRQLTQWFIDQDPTAVVLTPHQEKWLAGAKKMVALPDRNTQIVKFIYPGGDGIGVEEDHNTRRFDFIIVAEYNADIQIWDSFDHLGNHYVVEWIDPYNGYELKVGGSSHGPEPDYG